jgi:hypothetical protein
VEHKAESAARSPALKVAERRLERLIVKFHLGVLAACALARSACHRVPSGSLEAFLGSAEIIAKARRRRARQLDLERSSKILPLGNTTAGVLRLRRNADGRVYSRQRRDLLFILSGDRWGQFVGRNYRLCADGQMIRSDGASDTPSLLDEHPIRVGIRTLRFPSQ